jgi:hypothetical protein
LLELGRGLTISVTSEVSYGVNRFGNCAVYESSHSNDGKRLHDCRLVDEWKILEKDDQITWQGKAESFYLEEPALPQRRFFLFFLRKCYQRSQDIQLPRPESQVLCFDLSTHHYPI